MAELDRAQQHDSSAAAHEADEEQASSAAGGPGAVAASPALHRRAANRTKAKRDGRRADADAWHEANPELVQQFNGLTHNAYGQGSEVSVEGVEDFQRAHPPLIVDGKITDKTLEMARQAGSESPSEEHEAQEGEHDVDDGNLDHVTALIHEARQHPDSKEVKEQLEKLNVKGLERFIDTLSFDSKVAAACKELIAEAKELKEHQETVKERIPHAAKDKKEGVSKSGYLVKGKKKAKDKELGSWGAFGAAGKGNSHLVTGGKDVSDYVKAQDKHEKDEKKAEKEEKSKKEGFVAKHTHVGGTLAKAESKDHKAYLAEKKGQFGSADGAGGSYHVEGPGVSAKGSAELGYDRDKGLTAGASGTAKATLASGGMKLHSAPLRFAIAGEQFIASATAKLDAMVGAELKGNAELALTRKGAGAEVGLSGFAGAKVEGSIAGSIDWVKKTGEEYAQEALKYAPILLSHWIPPSVAHALPQDTTLMLLNAVLPKILGTRSGDVPILGAEAKGSASAGLGAEANAGFSFEGGVIKCRANAGLTIGAGLGGSFDVSIGAFDGMRCLAVLLAKGAYHVAEDWHPERSVMSWLQTKAAEAKAAIAAFCQEYQNDPHHGRWARMIVGQAAKAFSAV